MPGAPSPRVVGIGEVLWDVFPDQKILGGAPLNFAVHAQALGAQASMISRVGHDADGDAIRKAVAGFGLPLDGIQVDDRRPTGTVLVKVDAAGVPDFTIVEDTAWDAIEETDAARRLAAAADAVCFGTLAQRSPRSRGTIRALLGRARQARWIVYDVNFRQHFYSLDVVAHSLRAANLLKLNEDELPALLRLLERGERDPAAALRAVMAEHEIEIVCVTMGAAGCRLYAGQDVIEAPGYRVKVADTVGAGDAFTAGLLMRLLAGDAPAAAADFANRVGAFVASRPGGTPILDRTAIAAMKH